MVVFVTMNRKRQASSELDAISQPKKLKQDEISCPVKAQGVYESKFGIMGPIRRVASLNAEMAVHLLLSDSPPASPMGTSLMTNGHVQNNSSNHVAPHVNGLPKSLQNGHDSIPLAMLNSDMESGIQKARKFSDSSVEPIMTPLSSLSSDSEESPSPRMRSPQPKLKEAVISLVDCKKRVKSETAKGLVKKVKPKPFTASVDSGGYVKRMASLNARARVTALIEPEKRVTKASTPNLYPLTQVKEPPKCPSPAPIIPEPEDKLKMSLSCECIKLKVNVVQPKKHSVASGDIQNTPVHSMEKKNEPTQEDDGELDDASYTTLGLLYNGDTIYPSARVLLTNERTLPKPILPMLVPVCGSTLGETIMRAKMQHKRKSSKPKAQKSDNGWTPLGNPIKKAKYMKGNTRILRRYYAGIRRKDEEVYVRDCVVIRSGRKKQDKPYVAKITSLWHEESEGIMMTVFWYYRPEDANGANVADFQECEVLASQHHDENSVACIEDKCYVLGYRQYCRYRAMVQKAECGLETKSPTVPRESKFGMVDGEDRLVPENIDLSLVYLCRHGYNHITGRVCK